MRTCLLIHIIEEMESILVSRGVSSIHNQAKSLSATGGGGKYAEVVQAGTPARPAWEIRPVTFGG